MEVDSDCAFRAVRKNGSMILNSGMIDTINLVRALDSEEVISSELYEEMTDKTKDWGNVDGLEYLLKTLRTDIRNDGKIFVSFAKVLNSCGYTNIASSLLTTYNTLAEEAKHNSFLYFTDNGDLVCKPLTSEELPSPPNSIKQEAKDVLKPLYESKGYEEFGDTGKYGEPQISNLLDWVVHKIPSKWYIVGVKLGYTAGVLDGIKSDLSLGGDPKKMFQKVLANWQDSFPSRYNWCVLLQILASPSVGETNLANKIATQLKGEPYFGPEEPQFQEPIAQRSDMQLVDLEPVQNALVKVIESNYQRLNSAIDSSLPSFARLLLEADIVSRDVCKQADYNSIMQSFTAGLSMKTTLKELEDDCRSFIKALKIVGGPGRLAAQRIAQQWQEQLQTKIGISFNIET